MKLTIKDIARIAEVSTATVSMILNNKDENISPTTRDKVKRIVKENNYIPNTMARSLVTRQTKTIGLVIPDITNPFFPELARGAEDKANEAGYNIIFCNTDDDLDKEEKYINMLAEKMVDGIVFTHSAKRIGGLSDYGWGDIPIVLIDRDLDSENVKGKVLVNNLEGAYQGVKHLLDRGYKKIAFITGALTSNTARHRFEGYKNALEAYGIPYDPKYVRVGQYRSEWGVMATTQLLEEKLPFDAVFCGNDLIAISVIKTLKDAGLSIPGDIGVVGFDDIYMASIVEPGLTTVKQPNYEMGYKAVELLIAILEKSEREIENNKIILNTELIIRKSS
jgi:LacI family transcriptional regulator